MTREPCLEMWGGVECTVNRVGNDYIDQLERNGHDRHIEDLDLFAALGIRAMRYPVLWERTAPNGPAQADWSWADARLERLRTLDIRPIVGLVHHGSGPRHTSLIDPRFPEGLAEFAAAVAEHFPWVEDYTPVNEPLTTARFSGLYGYWYPHGRDDQTFVRALLTQCRAVVQAMEAIRTVTPTARLIQTDDLGKTWSTPALASQAEYENHRRWITFDLLCGRVGPDHPMWGYLVWAGASEAELLWFQEHPCPPDIIGINHYLSSERFLDERLDLYPGEVPGGNGRDTYVDVLAARVQIAGAAGPAAMLRETWERYHLPIAITEAHNGCTREEQLRWLAEVWDAAETVRNEGSDIRAVTAWSLLGAYDWDKLVTRADGCYEPGVYDLRGQQPRPTALATTIRELATDRPLDHPL
ncbi:MAG TPA: family 1 glycosylhydrolase, partial [Herpetosiphonaceae bacterium]|nr:family 1 glycosylhydrolase [Herpetosiphonaceae bacterium]